MTQFTLNTLHQFKSEMWSQSDHSHGNSFPTSVLPPEAYAADVKAFERRLWAHQHVLRQFEGLLTQQVLGKLEDIGLNAERLTDMEPSEIGAVLRHPAAGANVKGCMDAVPAIRMEAHLQPITRSAVPCTS